MSNGKQETIADIVSEMRQAEATWHRSEIAQLPTQYLKEWSDRIEAAWKREREAVAEAAQICGEIGEMVGREESKNQSVTNCNRLGNVAKMREALINAYYAMFKFIKTPYAECDEMASALDGAIAALATPPRNCDRAECATTKSAAEWKLAPRPRCRYHPPSMPP